MHAGSIVRENAHVQITGAWPDRWEIRQYQDLGVLCAFVYEQARQQGAAEEAERFRNGIYSASPVTEQIMVYRGALVLARESLARWLSPQALKAIQAALATIRAWYPGVR